MAMYLKPHCFLSTVASTAAGAQERLTDSNIRVAAVTLQAERSNTGYVYVGDNQVSSTNYGVDLGAGDSITISAETFGSGSADISLKDIWLAVSVAGDGVAVLYFEMAD